MGIGLQGRVGGRFASRGGSAGLGSASAMSSLAAAGTSAIDGIVRDVAAILYPLLAENLFPQLFTGEIALSVHLDDGHVRHIKAIDSCKRQPGWREPASGVAAGGGAAGVAGGAAANSDVDHVLHSALLDLRGKLSTVSAGFFGAITLTIQVERGICKMITLERERFHRQTR